MNPADELYMEFRAARVEKFTPDAVRNNNGLATVASCSVVPFSLRIVIYKYTCIIGVGTKILSYRQTNGSEEAYYETKWLLGANIKQRKTECTRDEALMNGCLGCLNTLQIKAVAMPRSGEHQQVAAAVAL